MQNNRTAAGATLHFALSLMETTSETSEQVKLHFIWKYTVTFTDVAVH
jgi:hypothetical protein